MSVRSLTLTLAAAIGLATAPPASGQTTYIWNLNATGTWDATTANWLSGGVPTTYTSLATNSAVFGNVITANRSIGVVVGGMTAGTIEFNSVGQFFYTVGTAGNAITLDNGLNAAIISVVGPNLGAGTYSGSGGHTITGSPVNFTSDLNISNAGAFGATNLTIASAIGRTTPGGTITVGGQGNTTLSGGVLASVTGGLVKNGSGTLNLTTTNAFTGGLTINDGVVSVASDGAIGGTGSGVTLNAGGTIRFVVGTTVGSGRVFTVNGTPANPSGIDMSTASGITVTMAGTGQLVGSGSLRISGTTGTSNSILSVEGPNAGFTGDVTIGTSGLVGHVLSQRQFGTATTAAALRLQAAGSLANTTGVTVNNSAGLVITQPATAITGRLGTAPLAFNTGRFTYNTSANGDVAITETMGSLTATGQVIITGSSAVGPTAGTTLNFGNLTRIDNAVLVFRAPQTGTSGLIGGAPSSASVRYFFSNLTPDTITTGATRSVIPWAANITSTGGTFIGNFMTYDANGFRPLNQTTEVATVAVANGLATVGSGVNVRVTSGNQTIAVGGQTINSYQQNTTHTVTGTATVSAPGDVLTVTSGGWANFFGQTINNATINFPNGGYFLQGDNVNVQGFSRITGAGGLTVTSFSPSYATNFTNTPTGGNTFTGGLFIQGNGRVSFTLNNQLGNDGGGLAAGAITLGGGQLIYAPSPAATASLSDGPASRPITVNASNGTIGVSVANAVLQIPGTISGAGQMQFGGGAASNANGVVELTNPSANTYTGGTLVSTGVLRISAANQLGTGPVFLNGGTLQASGNLAFATAPTVTASSTIDTQANTITLNGGLSGSGGAAGSTAISQVLTKAGAGTLAIGAASNYAGGLTISALGGEVAIGGAGAVPNLGPVIVGRSGTLSVNDAIGPVPDRVGRSTNITLTNNGVAGGANLNLTANAAGSTFAFGTLTVSGGLTGNVNNSAINITDTPGVASVIRFTNLAAIGANNFLALNGSTNFGIDSNVPATRLFFDTPPTLTGGVIPGVTFTGFGGTGPATYDPAFGVILYVTTTGSFIDNISNVGPGSPTPINTNFVTDAATTANLGATIKSLTVSGHAVTLVPGVNSPSGGNGNAPADTLVLTSGNLVSQTGASTLTAASPTVVRFGATGTATANVTANANLLLDANVTALTSGGLLKSGSGTLTIAGPNQITGDYNLTAGGVVLNSATSAASLTGVSTTTLAVNAPLTLNGVAGTPFTFAGTISGSAALATAAGFTNQQILTGTNTGFTGAITINGGTLIAGSAAAFGPATNPAVTVNAGGTMGIQGGITLNPLGVTLNGGGAPGRNGALDNISGTNTYNGPITLASNASIGATSGTLNLGGGITAAGVPTFNVATGATVNLTTVPLNIGANALVKNGGGVLVLPNLANTTGDQNVNGGRLRASADNNLGATTNVMNLNGGGFQYGAAFVLDPTRQIVLGPAGGTIDTNTFSPASFVNVMTGPGSFTKTGTGTLPVNAAQAYLGSTTVTGGVLQLGLNNAIPNTPLTVGNVAVSDTSSQLALNGFDLTVPSLTMTARGSGSVPVVTGPGTLTVNGTIAYVDNTAFPGNAFPGSIASSVTAINLGGAVRDITIAGNNNTVDFTFNAPITNGGVNYTGTNSVFSPTTPARMAYAASNTYAGGTTINSGTLIVNSGVTMAAPTGALTVNSAGPPGTNSLLTLNSSQTVGSLAGSVSGGGSATINFAAAGTLTVDQSSTTAFAGAITGTNGALTKTGVGALYLNGVNTAGGAFLVQAGTLGGSGSIAGALTVNTGATFAPGASVGTFTSTNNTALAATFQAGANWEVELSHADTGAAPVNGTTHDFFFNNGGLSVLNLGSTLNFVLKGTAGTAVPYTNGVPVTYTVATFNNGTLGAGIVAPGTTFTFDTTNFVPIGGVDVNAYLYAAQIVGNSLQITVTPVPEPATVLGIAAAAAGAAGLLRRRARTRA